MKQTHCTCGHLIDATIEKEYLVSYDTQCRDGGVGRCFSSFCEKCAKRISEYPGGKVERQTNEWINK
jgi:hypothetical protein